MNKLLMIILVVIVLAVIGGAIYYYAQGPSYQSNISQPEENVNLPGNNVTIQNFAFSPATITINKGGTVTWTNRDSAPHQISGNGFQSEVLGNGQSFIFTFNTAGTFDYICLIHTYMKGKIIVQ